MKLGSKAECFNSLFLLVFSCLLTDSSLLAQTSSFDGESLNLSSVKVGGDYYSAQFTIVSSDPVELVLSNAELLSNAPGGDPSTFSDNVIYVPELVVDSESYFLRLQVIGDNPPRVRLVEFGNSGGTGGNNSAESLFASSIESPIIQARCIVCHVEGGVASNSALLYQQSSDTSVTSNISVIEQFLNSRSDGVEYFLSKASGGENHTGGAQLLTGSTDYNNLSAFLNLLKNGGSDTVDNGGSSSFFSGVQISSNAAILRRASIVLAGRLPTDVESAAVQDGSESDLRSTVRSLMDGEGFHRFLVDGANDRLLVRGVTAANLLTCPQAQTCFPVNRNRELELALDDLANGINFGYEQSKYIRTVRYGAVESPLELIAYVVENDKPYTEILTADYMMLNPPLNFAVEGTATFVNQNDPLEFQPGQMKGYYRPGPNVVVEQVPETASERVIDPGDLQLDVPHAGVLNSISFLLRYPTTATNRNRARARWTLYHFLDIDIEKSASRTTDPVALADTNNPTMFNENCTVCHATLDPIAGAFQNYDEEGFYRSQYGGLDSLDAIYKYPEDGNTLYVEGDTWYRDMRDPGLFGEIAPSNDNSVQWLAQRIASDPGFASATVKFWWPALMGKPVLEQPEVETDSNYQERVIAFDAQNEAIREFASNFVEGGYNLKDLLVDMIVSPFFSAESLDSAVSNELISRAHGEADLGSEKLLTPERLRAKTTAITGFSWNSFYNFEYTNYDTGLDTLYRLYYGGINSSGVTKRSTELTPLMASVALTHALESACPIVLRDLLRPDGERLLFQGIDMSETPDNAEAEIRQKLVELHETFLGNVLDQNSSEINDAYELFVQSWNDQGNFAGRVNRCDQWRDDQFFEGTDIDPNYRSIVPGDRNYPTYEYNDSILLDFYLPLLEDRFNTKSAWITIVTYLMTHYDFLYE